MITDKEALKYAKALKIWIDKYCNSMSCKKCAFKTSGNTGCAADSMTHFRAIRAMEAINEKG